MPVIRLISTYAELGSEVTFDRALLPIMGVAGFPGKCMH